MNFIGIIFKKSRVFPELQNLSNLRLLKFNIFTQVSNKMKYITLCFSICSLVLISCSNTENITKQAAKPSTNMVDFRDITVDNLPNAFGNASYTLIDVRTPEEIALGMIDGATHIDFVSLDFKEDLNKLDKEDNYVIYCRSGGRSSKTIEVMKILGFKNVANLEGGYLAYTASQ